MGLWCHMHLINQLSRDLGVANGYHMTLNFVSGLQLKGFGSGGTSIWLFMVNASQGG